MEKFQLTTARNRAEIYKHITKNLGVVPVLENNMACSTVGKQKQHALGRKKLTIRAVNKPTGIENKMTATASRRALILERKR
jgi:hypothetical protein